MDDRRRGRFPRLRLLSDPFLTSAAVVPEEDAEDLPDCLEPDLEYRPGESFEEHLDRQLTVSQGAQVSEQNEEPTQPEPDDAFAQLEEEVEQMTIVL